MPLRPICEPVELPPGTSFVAERVLVDAESAAIGEFVHFHDVAELVLFKKVAGCFIAGGRSQRIADGAIVFVPSMHSHDFALERGAMEWVLVQFDPDLVQTIALSGPSLGRPFCLLPDDRLRARIDLLSDWLLEQPQGAAPEAERIIELLLLALARATADDQPGDEDASPVDKLLPALELLRKAPASPIALEEAASMCRLSPAYFSRRFRQLFGMTFGEYARTYRLRLGARRLLASAAPISKIAYGVGFSSPAHFTARFRERFGMTPRQYRASARMRPVR